MILERMVKELEPKGLKKGVGDLQVMQGYK